MAVITINNLNASCYGDLVRKTQLLTRSHFSNFNLYSLVNNQLQLILSTCIVLVFQHYSLLINCYWCIPLSLYWVNLNMHNLLSIWLLCFVSILGDSLTLIPNSWRFLLYFTHCEFFDYSFIYLSYFRI